MLVHFLIHLAHLGHTCWILLLNLDRHCYILLLLWRRSHPSALGSCWEKYVLARHEECAHWLKQASFSGSWGWSATSFTLCSHPSQWLLSCLLWCSGSWDCKPSQQGLCQSLGCGWIHFLRRIFCSLVHLEEAVKSKHWPWGSGLIYIDHFLCDPFQWQSSSEPRSIFMKLFLVLNPEEV